jgi:ABC-type multidrug transport system ATPase subunit
MKQLDVETREPYPCTGTGHGLCIAARGLDAARHGHVVLRGVDLYIEPGEVVALIGASGAGKSTLLDTLAGLQPAVGGDVLYDGRPTGTVERQLVGYVPQDDLIHRDLTVAGTLHYAARLRLPAGTDPATVERAVTDTLGRLDLVDQARIRVAHLSGGQRKRVSVGVELVTQPRAMFLDEPTSGLDPGTAATLMETLRRLAGQGTTVVLTTHNTADLLACDRVVMLTDGGVGFAGTPDEACRYYGVEHVADLYRRAPATGSRPPERLVAAAQAPVERPLPSAQRHPGAFHQWWVLTGRNLGLLRHNRLTLSIMLGAPALVILMFAMLFRPGALNSVHPDASAAVSTTYWMAFAAFFFGLTYGLLQICTELPIVRREVAVGVRIGPYLAGKVSVLAPVLAVVDVTMIAVLRVLDRLPALDVTSYMRLGGTLLAASVAALALGLLASAGVADAAQATLALPLLCFPAVLFAGAILPVPIMNAGGRALSVVTIARWAFEAAGRDLNLGTLLAVDHGRGPALLAQYGGTFAGTSTALWIVLTAFAAVLLAATASVLRLRTR